MTRQSSSQSFLNIHAVDSTDGPFPVLRGPHRLLIFPFFSLENARVWYLVYRCMFLNRTKGPWLSKKLGLIGTLCKRSILYLRLCRDTLLLFCLSVNTLLKARLSNIGIAYHGDVHYLKNKSLLRFTRSTVWYRSNLACFYAEAGRVLFSMRVMTQFSDIAFIIQFTSHFWFRCPLFSAKTMWMSIIREKNSKQFFRIDPKLKMQGRKCVDRRESHGEYLKKSELMIKTRQKQPQRPNAGPASEESYFNRTHF